MNTIITCTYWIPPYHHYVLTSRALLRTNLWWYHENSRHHTALSLAPRMSMCATIALPYQLDVANTSQKKTNQIWSFCLQSMSCRVIIYIHLQASRAKLKGRWLQYPNTAISKILHQRNDFGDDTSSGSKLLVIFLRILLKTSPNLSPDVFQWAMFGWMDGWMDRRNCEEGKHL